MSTTGLPARFAERWERFWYRPASPLGPAAARSLVAANALWIVLSRADLPEVVAWPPEFWTSVTWAYRVRYLMSGHLGLERVLFAVLVLALLAALFGRWHRGSCLLSALLLYRLAPLDNVISSRIGPYFNGLTLPVVALAILAFAPAPRLSAPPSPEYRWPLALVQMHLCFNYVFPGLSKLLVSGLAWMTADNMRGTILVFNAFEPPPRLLAIAFVRHPLACQALAIATVVVEVLFFLVLFSRRARRVLVPLAAATHVGIVLVLGVMFLNLPLLALFLDWDSLDRRWRARPRSGAAL
jgi:hypothetical protein